MSLDLAYTVMCLWLEFKLFKSRVMGFQFFVAPLNVPVRNSLGPGGSNVEPTLVLL